MKTRLLGLAVAVSVGCGQGQTKAETQAEAPVNAGFQQETSQMWDEVDLKCTQAEYDYLKGKLGAGTGGWDPNLTPWKQVGNDFFFIPEAVSGSGGHPEVVLNMAKALIQTMPP